jgi:hypothetical protein
MLKTTFPDFSNDDIAKVLLYYPSTNASADSATAKFATSGSGPATAINVSEIATGQRQRAYNIIAETTIVCPGYWLAEAFSGGGRKAYKYQYSLPG